MTNGQRCKNPLQESAPISWAEQVEQVEDGALSDVLEAFKQPENHHRLEEARDHAGNDMLRAMQIVFPVATQIQMEVIERYGFSSDGDGIIRFTQAVKVYEKQDEEIAQLNYELRTVLIPALTVQVPNGDQEGT